MLSPTLLEIHHTAEDERIWPLLRRRVKDQELFDEMAAEHAALDPLLAAVGPAFEAFARGIPPSGIRAQQADLARSLEAVRDALSRHLAHEEDDALSLMGRHLTPAEWDAFVEPHRRGNSRKGARWFLLWMLEDAPPPARAAVLERQSRWRRVTLTRFWEPAYRRTTRATFASP
jgi:hypothetical protein